MKALLKGFEKDSLHAWRNYVSALEKAIEGLERNLKEAVEMRAVCTDEWCRATEHVIDEIGNALFAISEPRWSTVKDSQRIRSLKRRLHDLYARYKSAPRSRPARAARKRGA